MITIQNGKLTIPDDDRFVGFAGDNAVNTKQFVLCDFARQNCTFTLCLRFDDDSVRTAALTAAASGGDTVLTWNIQQEHLYSSGVVQAQVKITDSDNHTEHTTKDFFLIGSTVELDEDEMAQELVTLSQLRESISEALRSAVPVSRKVATLPLSEDIGATELMAQLRPLTYKTNVLPGSTSGVKGQLGIGPSGEVFFCTATDSWVHLTDYEDLYEKMDLVTDVPAAEIDEVEDGNFFFSSGVLYVKHNGSNIAVAQAGNVYTKAQTDAMIGNVYTKAQTDAMIGNVYTKAQIDAMIGDLKTLLAAI